ncbi:sensor histidine kinase [Paenibacillus sp. PAMC21692]|uniref:sensor histidine kinase n=1 Tax=Paenibacillus sp. PAMC21692 TaxID=2762320 RepID=UPI00164E617F|nr:histidine kinase [Paenibacillus sp. PAMC21692]QNK57456.1 histidine kinase [Paenibacillus sp. PAMC21692]
MDIIRDFLLQISLMVVLMFAYEIFFAERRWKDAHAGTILTFLYGTALLFCMTFPAYSDSLIRMDIRMVPLLLGTMYGGVRTGLLLSGLIILYRLYLGVDPGFFTTSLTLLISMPVILIAQRRFETAGLRGRIQLAVMLALLYSMTALLAVSIISGISYPFIQMQLIYISVAVICVLFFVSLGETVKGMMRRNRQLQSEAKDAEIAILRSQINPHFLSNALNSIAALCRSEPRLAEQLTLDLSQYLRGSFDFKKLDSLTSFENELEMLQAYLNIEQVRYRSRLHVEYKIEADPQLQIPPLILQPLVENAVKHGLMPTLKGGKVIITATQIGEHVRFTVEDNGCGMSATTLDQLFRTEGENKGIGLWNIHRRLQLLYGRSLSVESVEGSGTRVWFEIPATTSVKTGG